MLLLFLELDNFGNWLPTKASFVVKKIGLKLKHCFSLISTKKSATDLVDPHEFVGHVVEQGGRAGGFSGT